MSEPLVKIRNLYAEYKTDKGIFGGIQTIHALNGINLDIYKGEILALAGESGCGKSTLARAIIRLEPVKAGEITFECRNVLNMDKKKLKS